MNVRLLQNMSKAHRALYNCYAKLGYMEDSRNHLNQSERLNDIILNIKAGKENESQKEPE